MSIQKRTVFYDTTGSLVRFLDWAIVSTTLGSMAEPFIVNGRRTLGQSIENHDFTDEINRVDEIRQMDVHKSLLQLSGGVHQLNGGTLSPRVGP